MQCHTKTRQQPVQETSLLFGSEKSSAFCSTDSMRVSVIEPLFILNEVHQKQREPAFGLVVGMPEPLVDMGT